MEKITNRYKKSNSILNEALKVIPLGTQTFSKSITQFPYGSSPFFAKKAQGSYIWDVDGNKYLDMINGLSSVLLGYCDIDINNAIKNQLERGITFSLSTELEKELALRLVKYIPSAEKVRFAKNGSDATSGAIRVARAITNKDHVLVCGYHGWQDWYIGSTSRNKGVPKELSALTHHFIYNDLNSLEKLLKNYKENVAAVIMEPMASEFPKKNFLSSCKDLAHKFGALFIFDETITGFRFSIGGAQEYFGVTPDLSTFGKGLGNGMPISALVGKEQYMDVMNEIFFSSTFGGETLSIAASIAVIDKIIENNVIKHLHAFGTRVIDIVNKEIKRNNLLDVIRICGHPSWSFLSFSNYGSFTSYDIKTLFIQESFKNGLMTFGTHNISYSHDENEVTLLEKIYKNVFATISRCLEEKTLYKNLNCEPLRPLFKVR